MEEGVDLEPKKGTEPMLGLERVKKGEDIMYAWMGMGKRFDFICLCPSVNWTGSSFFFSAILELCCCCRELKGRRRDMLEMMME